MPSGGARARSGPPPSPTSKRSERRGLADDLRPLDAAGYKGEAPTWPLPTGDAQERALWAEVWESPQAIAWASEPWRWRTIAAYCRWQIKAEDPDASPPTMAQAMRLADNIGITAAGLALNGWGIDNEAFGADAGRSAEKEAPPPARRMRAVPDAC